MLIYFDCVCQLPIVQLLSDRISRPKFPSFDSLVCSCFLQYSPSILRFCRSFIFVDYVDIFFLGWLNWFSGRQTKPKTIFLMRMCVCMLSMETLRIWAALCSVLGQISVFGAETLAIFYDHTIPSIAWSMSALFSFVDVSSSLLSAIHREHRVLPDRKCKQRTNPMLRRSIVIHYYSFSYFFFVFHF